MNSIESLFIGLFLTSCSIVTLVALFIVQHGKERTDFTILTLSDTLATMLGGLLFLMNTRDTGTTVECNPLDLATTIAMHIVPAINGFLSMAAWAFQTMNHIKNNMKQSEAPTTFMQRNAKYLGPLPSWFIPVFAMLPVLFSQPSSTRTVSNIITPEQCASEFTITKSICYDYVEFNENNSSSANTSHFETIFLPSHFMEEPMNNQLDQNIEITKQNIIQRVYSIVTENATLQNDIKLRHAIGNNTNEIVTPKKRIRYRQKEDANYYLNFLTNALAIATQHSNENSSLFTPLIWFNNTAFTKAGSNLRPEGEPSKSNVLIMGGLASMNPVTKDNVGVGQVEISDTDEFNEQLTQVTNKSNSSQMFPNDLNKKPDSTNMQHIMEFVKFHKNSTNTDSHNNSDCYIECRLPETFSKRLLFIILLICYFVPTVLSVSFQMNAANSLEIFEMQGQWGDKAVSYKHTKNITVKRVLELSRKSAITSVLLLSPGFLDTVTKSVLCLDIPTWISSAFLMIAHSQSAVRSVFNIKILKSCLSNYANIEPIVTQAGNKEITKGGSKVVSQEENKTEKLIIENIDECVSEQVPSGLPKLFVTTTTTS